MATDLERLVVSFEANLKQYERELARAQKTTVSSLRKIERDAQASVSRVEGVFSKLGGFVGGVLGGLLTFQSVRQIREIVASIADIGDAAQRLGVSTAEFQELAFAAKLGGVEVETFAKGLKFLAINTSEAVRGQGDFGAILQANNVSITDANGKLLSQTEILKKVADLVKNAASEQDKIAIAQAALGKSGSDLVLLLEEGADGVAKAMEQAASSTAKFSDEQIKKAQEIDDKFDTLINTITVGLKQGILETTAATIHELELIGQAVDALIGTISNGIAYIQQLRGLAVTAPGKGDLPSNINPQTFTKPLEITVTPAAPTIIPKKPSRSGSSRVKTRSEDELQREIAAITERTAALRLEAEALGKTTFEAEKAKAAHELLNAAHEAGVKITPELSALIEKLATSYADAAASIEQLEAQQERINEINGAIRDSITGFVDDLRSGESAVDALTNALDGLLTRLTDLALNSALDQLFGTGSSGSTGLLGSFIGNLFGGARASGGPVTAGKGYVVGENGPEWFQPGQSGSIIPRLGRAANANVQVIDMRTNAPAIERQTGPDGSIRLLIRDEVNRTIGSGQADKALALRTGGAPVKTRR